MSPRRVARPAVLRHVPLDRHALLEASAGTGKTFTLEHLVVELVLSGEVTLDQVLVVTFTEKATNELRVRVRAKLEELHAGRGEPPTDAQVRDGDFWTIDDAARKRLGLALHAFDGATIATIHAFCQRVLRENAFASGRLFEEQQVDGRDSFGRAMREAMRREVARDPARAQWLEAGLRAGWSIERIEELLWRCVQLRGELRPEFDHEALQRALAAFPVEEARRLENPDVLRSWGMKLQTARSVCSRIYTLALMVETAREEGSAPAYVLAAAKEPEIFSFLAERLPPYADRPEPAGRLCAAALELARHTPSLPGALARTILGPVRHELARRKREAGQYDFDDMLSLVNDALHGPRGDALVAAMRERWRYALIDEFQDTDETQWSIFRRAFFEERGQGKSVVYLVGDPKQSIYRFRGADVDTYLGAREDVVRAGGARVALDRNFRATAALVDATNAVFDQQAPEPFFTGAIAYTPVACGRPERALVDADGRAVAPVHAFRYEREIPLASLAALVAREIRAITDPARPWRLDGQPLASEHVFVLTRSKGEGRIVGAALRAAGVPHAFYKEEGLFQTDEAREVRALLVAVDDPGDRGRRLAAWLTPFFGLPLHDVERARELPASHPYVARLQAWKVLADARDFERLFESIVRDSGVLRREIFFASGERELTNYLHVFELLLEHARRTHATLRDLMHALSGLIDQTRMPLEMEGNVQRLESERRAVQIMTIHKAKGLEAPVVFVIGGHTRGPGAEAHVFHEGGRRLAWVGGLTEGVKAQVRQEEREEDQRLMYVALTRAKGRLYLPLLTRERSPMRGPYRVVNRRLAELATAGHPSLSVEDAPHAVLTPIPTARDAQGDSWQPPGALLGHEDATAEYGALRERHAGAIVTSYTRMRAQSGARSAWTEEREERRARKGSEAIDEAPATTLRSARASGVFVHEVLERVPMESFAAGTLDAWRARPDVRALLEEALATHRVDPAQREHAERLVWGAYTTPVELPGGRRMGRFAEAARVVREMEFVFPVPEARAYVRGSLDLALEHEGLTYFVDWKTDSLSSYEAPALGRHTHAHYEDQVQLYALAVIKLLGVTTREGYDARFGGLLYCFLRGFDERGRGLWSTRPTWDDVRSWEAALRARRRWGRGS
ncbi:MAG TPA: UvrD-helicase domain-containing protein [Polyangiaceae bacterium]